jgi:hypothetical protein
LAAESVTLAAESVTLPGECVALAGEWVALAGLPGVLRGKVSPGEAGNIEAGRGAGWVIHKAWQIDGV